MSKKIIRHSDGVVYWHIISTPKNVTIDEMQSAYQEACDYWNTELYPMRLQYTSNRQKAHIRLYACKTGDDVMCGYVFKPNAMASARYPDTDNAGDIYINDAKNWASIIRDHRWLAVHTIAHEIGHSLGLEHDTNNPNSLMGTNVSMESELLLSEWSEMILWGLYIDEWKAITPQTLRRTKYDTLDERQQDKMEKILEYW